MWNSFGTLKHVNNQISSFPPLKIPGKQQKHPDFKQKIPSKAYLTPAGNLSFKKFNFDFTLRTFSDSSLFTSHSSLVRVTRHALRLF
jgi:hypothetical protein